MFILDVAVQAGRLMLQRLETQVNGYIINLIHPFNQESIIYQPQLWSQITTNE
ncbi:MULTISPECIES: hypothetical protein [Aphanizomenonaceae]|uniref:Uncharacterized protein n=1 Tax=Dolichospermum heterosporum TAC447 TaxID=747523 RepID=A0ABY5M2T4_9CYAN|nr:MULTISPECIES: hypothetical protein [Aphanizomenonaceae]UUO16139.1 hypothetical protein NG743_03575 [Dolichospermum heterosporum TAC447]